MLKIEKINKMFYDWSHQISSYSWRHACDHLYEIEYEFEYEIEYKSIKYSISYSNDKRKVKCHVEDFKMFVIKHINNKQFILSEYDYSNKRECAYKEDVNSEEFAKRFKFEIEEWLNLFFVEVYKNFEKKDSYFLPEYIDKFLNDEIEMKEIYQKFSIWTLELTQDV